MLAGCEVGPDYVKPDTPITDTYKEPPPDAFKDAGTWNQAVPADAALRSNWWRCSATSSSTRSNNRSTLPIRR